GKLAHINTTAGLDSLSGQPVNRHRGHDEPATDPHRGKRVLTDRAVERVGVAAQNLRRLTNGVERRRTGTGHSSTHSSFLPETPTNGITRKIVEMISSRTVTNRYTRRQDMAYAAPRNGKIALTSPVRGGARRNGCLRIGRRSPRPSTSA